MVNVEIICPCCRKRIRTVQSENMNPTITMCSGCHNRIRYSVSKGRASVSRA